MSLRYDPCLEITDVTSIGERLNFGFFHKSFKKFTRISIIFNFFVFTGHRDIEAFAQQSYKKAFRIQTFNLAGSKEACFEASVSKCFRFRKNIISHFV